MSGLLAAVVLPVTAYAQTANPMRYLITFAHPNRKTRQVPGAMPKPRRHSMPSGRRLGRILRDGRGVTMRFGGPHQGE